MVLIRDGISPSRKGREGRPILTLGIERPSSDCFELPGIELQEHSDSADPAQCFEAALWADRNRWDIARRSLPEDAENWLRGGGFAGRGKLSKSDADTLLTRALTALGGAR